MSPCAAGGPTAQTVDGGQSIGRDLTMAAQGRAGGPAAAAWAPAACIEGPPAVPAIPTSRPAPLLPHPPADQPPCQDAS